MTAAYKSRLLVWAGPLFAAAMLASGFLLEPNSPGEKATATEVLKYYNSHHGRTLTEMMIGPALAALVLLFAAELRSRARERGDRGAGPSVLFGGAVVWASGMLVGAVVGLG